ncbi:MAG TPA: ATP-binding protein [Usitatibacter sp.]|nr:ATP-binding protein [Usitatibacter sp.]
MTVEIGPLLDDAPCGFFSLGDDGRLQLANATLGRMLGASREAVVGRHVDSLFTPASRIFYQTHVYPMLKLELRVQEIYVSLRTQAGEELPVLLNGLRTQRGGIAVNDFTVVPMSRRNEYENEILAARRIAEEATRAKDEFLAVVSHELRTPLNSIAGWAHMLSTGKLDAATMERAVQAIVRNARMQTKLIDDILDFARIISGKLRLDVGPVDLAPIVDAALEGVAPAAQAKSIHIDRVVDAGVGPISGDADRVQQILWNLLTNAVKFTPTGGRVQLKLSRSATHAQIAVSDTGRGISAEFLPFVFERFRQADDSAARREGGLGLGMSITRHLVELHGGTIQVASEGEGRGATFTLCLPLMDAAPAVGTERALGAPTATAAAEPPSLAGLHVLVAEDDREGRELLVAILGRSGARVSSAASAAEAFERFEAERPDLLVSDLEMEAGGDGYALLQRVREHERTGGARMPAIALTGHTRSADRLRALAAGFQMHIAKPVEPNELVMMIANLAQPRS